MATDSKVHCSPTICSTFSTHFLQRATS